MKKIPLTQGQFAIVDDEDFEEISRWNWQAGWTSNRKGWIAKRSAWSPKKKKQYCVLMHRQILRCKSDEEVDHRDHNGLNNQRSNIRKCSRSQNTANVRPYNGVKGVTKYQPTLRHKLKWRARITISGKSKVLGYFDSIEEARDVYNAAAKEYFGDFACVNTI